MRELRPSTVLIGGRKIIEEGRWCKNHYRNTAGDKFCALGATMEAAGVEWEPDIECVSPAYGEDQVEVIVGWRDVNTPDSVYTADRYLDVAAMNLYGEGRGIAALNDRKGTRRSQILKCYDTAIEWALRDEKDEKNRRSREARYIKRHAIVTR